MNLDGSISAGLPRRRTGIQSHDSFRNGDLGYVVEREADLKGHGSCVSPGGRPAPASCQTEDPVPALAVSREGDRLAYVVGKITDAAKGRVEFSFFLQSTAPGSPSIGVPLNPGEQILSPSF